MRTFGSRYHVIAMRSGGEFYETSAPTRQNAIERARIFADRPGTDEVRVRDTCARRGKPWLWDASGAVLEHRPLSLKKPAGR